MDNKDPKLEAQAACGRLILAITEGKPSIWDDMYKIEMVTLAYRLKEKLLLEQYDLDDEVIARELSAYRAKYGY